MKTWTAIIFDMDGTLFDTENLVNKAWYFIKDKYHLPINDEFISLLKGRTRADAQPIYDKYMPCSWDQKSVQQDIKNFMINHKLKYGPGPKADLIKLFEDLKGEGYRLALCSSSIRENIDFNLSFENLHEYFDVIVDGSMAEYGKPAPDIYLKTAQLLGLKSDECLVIEDSINGILSGYHAGMDVIMVVDTIQPTKEIKAITYRIFEVLDDIRTVV